MFDIKKVEEEARKELAEEKSTAAKATTGKEKGKKKILGRHSRIRFLH